MKFSVIDELDRALREQRESNKREGLHVTHLVKCMRAVVYELLGKKPEISNRSLRVFANGTSTHLRLQYYADKAGILVQKEVPIFDETLGLRGSADAILKKDDVYYVLEIKGVNTLEYKRITEPREQDLDQINMYMHYLKIKKGKILYENKNTQEQKEYDVEYDEKRVKKLLDKARKIIDMVNKKMIPAREYDPNVDWQCSYCPYSKYCLKDEIGGDNHN